MFRQKQINMHFSYVAIVCAAMFIFFNGCLKPVSYPPEPAITDVYFSRDTVENFAKKQSAIGPVLNIDFEDGDGDIGFSTSDSSNNVTLIDDRNGNETTLGIPYDLESTGGVKAISGTLTISLTAQCCSVYEAGDIPCTPQAATPYAFDTLTYTVTIKDRAGNVSNAMQTEPLYILCEP